MTKQAKFKPGDWIINLRDRVFGVTIGKKYQVTDYEESRGMFGSVFFHGDNSSRMRPANLYRLTSPPSPMDAGAAEYEEIMGLTCRE